MFPFLQGIGGLEWDRRVPLREKGSFETGQSRVMAGRSSQSEDEQSGVWAASEHSEGVSHGSQQKPGKMKPGKRSSLVSFKRCVLQRETS